MTLAPGTRLGAYDITGVLGAGGMGEVYRARDTKLGREVALKILPDVFAADPERLARFQREAQVLASLNHANIAAIYGMEDRALVLELVEGPTLADRIAQGPIPLEEALPIARQMAEALEAAHDHGIVHRDLKPANIKLRPDGAVKVLDFGLAKLAEAGSTRSGAGPASIAPTITSPAMMTGVGTILGTAAYMSPEQARGKSVDRRADIWAFGCVLYEMLTGRAAFLGDDVSLTLSKILQRDPEWDALPTTPAVVRQLLRRCLDKDPRTRLRDIGEARILLSGTGDALGTAADTLPPPPSGRRSLPLYVALAGFAVAGLLGALALWALNGVRAPRDTAPPVVRLAVTLPSGEQIAGSQGIGNSWMPLAISPDGTRLAYISGGRLHLRPMDGLEIETTKGSEGAWSPFFSPDSQWVGFYAQGQLKKVSVKGGVAEPLCDAPAPAGATWAEDGTIYFAPANASGLWKVSSDGGMSEPVTTLDRDKGEVSHRWPQALPGGRAILYTVWRGPGWDEMELQVLRLDTGARDVVVEGGSTGRYVPSGHLVYGRAGQLTAVPFDLARLATTGAPVLLGIEARENEGSYYTVSDGGVLAYVPGPSQFERRLADIGPDGRATILASPPRPYEDAAISPDGRRAALTVSGATWNVWVQDLSRSTQTLLTRGAGSSQWPVWTHDGARIIYRGTRAGFRNVYWASADGTGSEERLTTGENLQTPRSVTPDGKWVAFDETDPKTGADIWVLPLQGDRRPQPAVKTPASESMAQFSPDGRWLAFQSDDSGRVEIYVQPFPGPGERVLVSTDGGIRPTWSADGRTLVYLQGTTVMTADVTPGPALRIGTPRPLYTSADYLEAYDVLTEGRHLLRIRQAEGTSTGTQIHVVVNWFEELRRLAGR